MSSRYRISLAFALLTALAAATQARELKVCAAPDQLPFSNRAGEGFENRIAARLAGQIGADLVLVPVAAAGHGFIRSTLGSGRCDALMGMPSGAEGVATTAPYYRSTWVFVGRSGEDQPNGSFEDPLLRHRLVGVPVVGEGPDTPPAIALGKRGLAANLRTYPAEGNASARLVEDLAAGRLDLAVLWGPSAGYFAARQGNLALTPTPPDDGWGVPLTLGIGVAVRRGNQALRDELEAALAREQRAIAAILSEFHVPLVAE